MASSTQNYRTRVSGWWTPRHTIQDSEGRTLGVLTVTRNWRGMVIAGEYSPEKGEKLLLRREPGLQRAQFSLWTGDREWLGSSIRPRPFQRRIDIFAGVRPYRVVPFPGLRRGWRVIASKTGEVATIEQSLLGRGSRWTAQKKVDFEMLLFSYFIGSLASNESILPTALDAEAPSTTEQMDPAQA
ncbi:MAG: hypothetical protein R3F17_11740 [Planctomycetota bacterium]